LTIAEAFERAGKPVVHVNPPSASATVNFVSADFHGASLRAGRALRESGRRRLSIVFASSFAMSVSEGMRMAGFLVGADPEGREKDLPRLIRARGVEEEDGYAAMREHLAHLRPPPDAVLCTGDFLALGAIRALTERGLRTPTQVSVIGGDGLDSSPRATGALTCIQQPMVAIGRAIVAMLCERAERGGAPMPGRFLPTAFTLGRTTRPAENSRLQ
ncbi:MAG: substrate-binding domain-containing protein, partial [Verrucomicrobiae bacterium]|nr:substrate-binding domain-containing protein [Verrucomicrobiae bacterium]